MSDQRVSQHGSWSGRWAFILAATGSAVGLGNIWKFPYITGEHGGGAFVLVYLLCVVLVGIPIMTAEIMLGRRGRSTPLNTMRFLAREAGANPHWQWLGLFGMLAGFMILSYYSVVAGWALDYISQSVVGTFDGASAEFVGATFKELLASPGWLLFWHTLFMAMTIVVVARGVEQGLERAVRFLMPALFVLLLILIGYALGVGEFGRGFAFLFSPDFSKLTWGGVLVAMGHAFFTLSLGMGAIMMYGAYLPREVSISKTTFMIAGTDTLVALMAGLAIFPIVFSNGMEPSAGPGLVFVTLPIAFGQMPGGLFFGTLFFVLLSFAAWSSAISLIEPAITWLVESKGLTRVRAAIYAGGAVWLLGVGSVLSFNLWSDLTINDWTYFDVMEKLTSNVMLPLGGLLIAIFAAWILPRVVVASELESNGLSVDAWRFITRFITPVAVVIVFLAAIGVIGG